MTKKYSMLILDINLLSGNSIVISPLATLLSYIFLKGKYTLAPETITIFSFTPPNFKK
jgi:hypothetical protein